MPYRESIKVVSPGAIRLRVPRIPHGLQVELGAITLGARFVDSPMKTPVPAESASALIDAKIEQLADWCGQTLARIRALIHAADPEIVEEWKWRGVPVWSHAGIVCTGETYKAVVKMTFARGAALPDPAGLFNSSLDGNVRRAIDIGENGTVDESALQNLIRAAVALNLLHKIKPRRG